MRNMSHIVSDTGGTAAEYAQAEGHEQVLPMSAPRECKEVSYAAGCACSAESVRNECKTFKGVHQSTW